MNIAVVIAAALLPAVLLWIYVWKKDTQKEPAKLLLKAVLWGMALCIPVAFFEAGVIEVFFHGAQEPNNIGEAITQAFVVAALPEEAFKLLALWLILRKNPYFDEHYDGIVYAVSVGLGFAAVENIFYVISSGDWLFVAISRALLAVPGHYAFAVLMGYFYSMHHFVDHSKRTAACILLVPVIAHGIYDSIAFSGALDAEVGGICSLILIIFCVRLHKFARKKMTAQIQRDMGGGDESFQA